MKHIVKLTLSNPSHEHVSMRMRMKQQDYITEGRDESEAINRAARHFQSLGFKVHSAVIVEQKVEIPEVNAEPVSLSEAVDYKALEKPTVARVKSGETKLPPRTNYDIPPAMRKKVVDKKAALEAFIARRKETVTEETAPQYIEEKLSAADPASKWIHDFVHSDNPKFAGKSKEERIKMALGAKYAAQRNEEVAPEEVDEETKQRKASVAKDKVGRLAWRAGTADEIKKNHLKVYKKLKSTDPEKAEKFKQAYKVEEEVEQGRGRLMNSHVAYLRPKKSAPSDVKDHFEVPVNSDSKKGAHGKFAKIFGSSMAKHYEVVHVKPTVAEEVEQVEEKYENNPLIPPRPNKAVGLKPSQLAKKPVTAEEVEQVDKEGYYVMGRTQSVAWHKNKQDAEKEAARLNMRGGTTHTVKSAARTDGLKKEEVEQVEEKYENNPLHSMPRPNKAVGLKPSQLAKKPVTAEGADDWKKAADPGETKVVNKAVKTKKASAAADRMVKIAKSKVNKINMDPKLDNDVKQSSRY
jgi:hypothetical protein